MSIAAESTSTGKSGPQLTPCEFEIMEILWRLGSGTVREVHAALQANRALAYTTVMTVMDKLHRKGALDQKRRGRAYVYTVRLSQPAALRQRIEHLIRHYFQGSTDRFLEYLREEFTRESETVPPPKAAAEPQAPEEDMDAALL